MFTLVRPTPARIAAFRDRASATSFTYTELGCTRFETSSTFTVDRYATELGRGDEAWVRAQAALRNWRTFDLGWVCAFERDAPIAVGTTVAVLIRSLGLWSLNAARIVYVVDERDRFGFAYGTLRDHAECGEERFLIERDAGEIVTYSIQACSRPHHPFTRIAHPWVRHLQRRFGRDSLAAMKRAVRTN